MPFLKPPSFGLIILSAISAFAHSWTCVARVAADALSAQCIELASKWLNACLSSHKACDPSPAAGCSTLPTRIADVGNDTHDPRLVLSADGSTGNYVALSHCWGGGAPAAENDHRYHDRPTGRHLDGQHALGISTRHHGHQKAGLSLHMD